MERRQFAAHMDVLHVYSGNLYGGIEAMLVTLARHRAAPAPRFALCWEGRLAAELRRWGTPPALVGPVRFSRPWTVARARRRLTAHLLDCPADLAVFHAPWSYAAFAPTARKLGLPVSLWLHDAWSGRTVAERLASRIRPDVLLCNSAFTADAARHAFPGVRREVIHCPVAPPPVQRTPSEALVVRSDWRARLRTPAADPVIVQVGRLEPWKGHAVLLDALAKLRDRKWTCWLVGGAQRPREARHQSDLQARAERLAIDDRLRWVGETDDVPGVLAAADIACQPSVAPEPFGIAVVEALYSGLPVVATAAGGALEVIDSSCGILVRPGSAPDLAGALARLLDDSALRSRLGAAGPARAARIADPGRQIGALSAVLAEIGLEAA